MVFKSPPDMNALLDHARQSLASYALPQFVRLLPQMEITGTFKHRKVEFVKDGLDIAKIADPLFWLDPKTKSYQPLDAAAYAKITAGRARL